ncbi:MAG: hypothetical protein ACLT98_07915 [Eggerthellaceae bacterium]
MRKDAIISMKNAAVVSLACAMVLFLCMAQPAYATVSGSIELSCAAEHAGEHVAWRRWLYADKVASAKSMNLIRFYVTEEAFSGVDRNWAALDGAGCAQRRMRCLPMPKTWVKPQATRVPMRRVR